MSGNSIRCMGGPLDGKMSKDYGSMMLHAEWIKPDLGETIAFGSPSVAQQKTHAYRMMHFSNGNLLRITHNETRYVHEHTTDEAAFERVRREWGFAS